MRRLLGNIVLAVGSLAVMMGQTPTFSKITTIAGSLPPFPTITNNLFLQAPDAVFVDPKGNVYIADTGGNRIWKIDTQGKLTLVAGTGVSGFAGDGKDATLAQLSSPSGFTMDSQGNLFFSDRGNNRVRKIDTTGVITTIAGQGTGRFAGDGQKATSALLNGPRQLAIDRNDNLYIADTGNHRIRKVTPGGIITTIAGSNSSNSYTDAANGDGGLATLARLDSPEGVAVDSSGNIFISDTGSCSLNNDTTCSDASKKARANRIRFVDAKTGIITTIAGRSATPTEQGKDVTGASLATATTKVQPVAIPYLPTCSKPSGVQGGSASQYFNNGTLVICSPNGDGRVGTAALLATPAGIAVDKNGNVFIADRDDNRVRMLSASSGIITTFVGGGSAGDGGAAFSASTGRPSSMAVGPDGSVYITEWTPSTPGKVRRVDPTTGIISTIAGITRGSNDGPALTAAFNNPWGVTTDANGNVYVSDTGAHKIRKIDIKAGTVTTIAGTGTSGVTDNGTAALGSKINSPQGIAFDNTSGTIYYAERGTNAIRSITTDGILHTIAGGGLIVADQYSGLATDLSLGTITGVAVDGQGNLYFAETNRHVVRKVTLATDTITTIAGQYQISGQEGDGGPAVLAQLNGPLGVAVDSAGNVAIADAGNHAIRVITPSGIILPVAGEEGFASRDAASTTEGSKLGYQRRLRNPEGVAFDNQGNFYITDTRNNGIRQVIAATGQLFDLTTNADNPNGNQIQTINFDDGGGDPKKSLLSSPKGITVDANGNVIFADTFNGMIRELSK